MKKIVLMSVAAMLTSLTLSAQDDLYFVPTKKNVESYGMPEKTYYSGSHRSVDEYNGMGHNGSYAQPIDSAGNDIVDFDGAEGVYPDSASDGDYTYTRRMSRFDDYAWQDPYWNGFYDGRASSWYMYDPWYSPYWYSSWYGYPYYGYNSWYWNDPWYWGGWYSPYYYHRPIYVVGGSIGTGSSRRNGRSYFGGSRFSTSQASSVSGFGSTRRSGGERITMGAQRSGAFSGSRGNSRSTFGGYRNNTSRNTYNNNYNTNNSRPSYNSSSSSFGSSNSSGSFGGSRGGGSFGGGSRSGGGFGGRR